MIRQPEREWLMLAASSSTATTHPIDGGMSCDTGEDIGEPGLRIDAIHLRRLCRRRTMPNGLVFPSIRGDGHVIGSA